MCNVLAYIQDLAGRERLEKFIEDCELLGPVRFVCMTDGAILESVGSFDNLRYSDQPKGRCARNFVYRCTLCRGMLKIVRLWDGCDCVKRVYTYVCVYCFFISTNRNAKLLLCVCVFHMRLALPKRDASRGACSRSDSLPPHVCLRPKQICHRVGGQGFRMSRQHGQD